MLATAFKCYSRIMQKPTFYSTNGKNMTKKNQGGACTLPETINQVKKGKKIKHTLLYRFK